MDIIDQIYENMVEEYETLQKEKLSKVKKSKNFLVYDNWFLNYEISKQIFAEESNCGVNILVPPNEKNFPYDFRFLCYPNGNCKENEGYVSFMFVEMAPNFKYCTLNFTFTLIDIEGNHRFPQSFAKEYGKFVELTRSTKAPYGIIRYMERDKLLSSDVFFSEMLHIKCEIHFYPKETLAELTNKPYVMSYSKTKEKIGTLYITDASHPLWTILAANSPYFKKLLIKDGARKIFPFYKEDYMALNVMMKSVLQGEDPHFNHTYEAIALYKFADRVLISELKRNCSDYLQEHMTARIVSEVIVMSDMRNDPLLKDFTIQYALKHWQEVIATKDWKILLERRPELVSEINDCKLGKQKIESKEIKGEVPKLMKRTPEYREQFQFYL